MGFTYVDQGTGFTYRWFTRKPWGLPNKWGNPSVLPGIISGASHGLKCIAMVAALELHGYHWHSNFKFGLMTINKYRTWGNCFANI
jgi:hypothetical protein